MEYYPSSRFELDHALKKNTIESINYWRCLHFEFRELPEDTDLENLATRIYKIFESLEGCFYFDPRARISVFCKMGEKVIIDDIAYKIKSLIKADFMYRIGEQSIIGNGIISIQFLFSPTSSEKKKLSQEFIMQERLNRQSDIIMLVEDDLFSRNIAKNALRSKFKLIEVSDGAKATQEYLAHSPDVLFLDIHLPNKKGPQILREIMEVDPQAYVVMLSADSAKDRIMHCMEIGAKGFIAKPFRGDKLFDYIRKCPTIRVYC
jgi:two-component system, chemotaxis family, chemotaxis protein CheY